MRDDTREMLAIEHDEIMRYTESPTIWRSSSASRPDVAPGGGTTTSKAKNSVAPADFQLITTCRQVGMSALSDATNRIGNHD